MKRITQFLCLTIILLPLLSFGQNSETRELLVYIYQMDHYWDWHHPHDNISDNISISYELGEEATKISQELNPDNEWYRFYMPINGNNMEVELNYRGKDMELEIPAGKTTAYITIYDERLLPYHVDVFEQHEIYPLLDPEGVTIEGKLDLPETVSSNFPQKVQLSMPFVNWDYGPTHLETAIKAEIDWRSARFEFEFPALFPTIGFIKLQDRFYPVMIQTRDHHEMEWKVGEGNALQLVNDFDEHHHHYARAQDFLNHRYPNGLNQEGYDGLVDAFMGSQEFKTDSLIAWSRSIADFYEEYRSDPENFLEYVNEIGDVSFKDIFEEAYETHNERKFYRIYGEYSEFLAVLMVGMLISLLVFAISVVMRVINSRFMNTQRFDLIEGILCFMIAANVLGNSLINMHHRILEVDPFPIWILAISVALIFFVNQKLLVPKLLLRKRWGVYLLAVAGITFGFFLLAGATVLTPLNDYRFFFVEEIWSWKLFKMNPGYHSGTHPEAIFMTHVMLLLVAPIYGLGRHLIFNRMPSLKIQKEALNAELHNLKIQISPHFFFNSLNTVYGFALGEESPKTAEAITKMSNLMRFAIYHGDKDFIPLEKELDYLADYIELQELRMNPMRHKLSFHIEGEAENQQIAPLLLITLVENAFKHGISMSHDSYIYIDLFIQKNGLILTVENSVHPSQKVLAGAENAVVEGGIGLSNTRQRLDLLYKGKYDWQIEESEDRYYAQLSLDL